MLLLVGGGVRDAVLVQMARDPADAHTAEIQLEDQPHICGGRLVDHQLVVVGRVFFVAVFGERANEVAAAALHVEGGADALGVGGDVVFVDHAAHGVVEEVDGGALTLAGVDQIVDGDVAHAQLRKDLADVPAALAGVSAEARAVFDDDAVDLLRVDVCHHSEKRGAFKICSRKAVVDVSVGKLDIRL